MRSAYRSAGRSATPTRAGLLGPPRSFASLLCPGPRFAYRYLYRYVYVCVYVYVYVHVCKCISL